MSNVSSLAPVVLFVYNRIDCLKSTIRALANNELACQSDLFIFSDGPKSDSDALKVNQVREYIRNIEGFASLSLVLREQNLGLANSIISGVTQIIDQYGKIIILEDDLVTSRFFLNYMNDGLDIYENDSRVATIQGCRMPWDNTCLPETYFLPSEGCLGWGTWKRAWKDFEPDARYLYEKIKHGKHKKEFDFDLSYPFTRLLKHQVDGKVDSWAIRWYASNFLLKRVGLYPRENFVQHIGYENESTHCSRVNDIEKFVAPLTESYEKIRKIPINIHDGAFHAIKNYYKRAYPQRHPMLEVFVHCVKIIIPQALLLKIRSHYKY
ncbi:hypothetical protein LJC31_07805 [Synergistaceae bacterium OttesenSCG-928-I11]|nr:hypothetical protein [Synergistaceae bacterium OttesenSCG-928-I11]